MEQIIDLMKLYVPNRWQVIALVSGASMLVLYYYDYFVKCRRLKIKMAIRKARSTENIEKLRLSLKQKTFDPTITDLPFEELRDRLKSGQLTATDVLRAYQAKAIEVNDTTNAITDIFPDAEVLAAEADLTGPEDRGPLHGIPISLKESCGIKGLDCTGGFGVLVDNPLPDDCVLLKVVKSCGAIPFIRTNVPQAMASIASENPIYGLTTNPFNASRTPGGSSSGEAAIIGGGGSILGIGSDLGGSIRIPASFCGIAGLKPTPTRLSLLGTFGYGTKLGGQTLVLSAYGPLGRDVDSLVHFMKAVLGQKMFDLDPKTPPITFNNQTYEDKRPLKIGFYTYDGCNKCVPAVVRAVQVAKKALEQLGHEVVEFKPPDVRYALRELFYPGFFGDELEGYRNLVKHDNSFETFYKWVRFCKYPSFIRWIIAKCHSITQNNPLHNDLFSRKVIRSVRAWQDKHKALYGYQLQFLKQWNESGLDVIICPCMPSAAFKHKLANDQLVFLSYTELYNTLAYPAGSLPITQVTAKDVQDAKDPNIYNPSNDLEHLMRGDSLSSEGMPVGIQVVGLPFREEMVLRVMKELETALKSNVK